jgi:frataxin-like iron-binding protein CyaY
MTSRINYREAYRVIDKIAEFVEVQVDDLPQEEQEYVLRALNDAISNIAFDRGITIISRQEPKNS